MDNESETRPLLHSFQSETWHRRARKRCMRIPSEITITGIILGLFLIVVTLLIVLENMESDKKEKNISLDDNLLASPMKFNKKGDDQTWQDKKDYMKFKNKQMEEKNRKWDKVNKGWKQLPVLSASPMKFNKKAEDQSRYVTKDYVKMKDKKMEEKSRKWDKVNKGWKKQPDISGNIHDHDYEEKQKDLNDDVETMIIGDKLDEYGKEVDDSLETFANLRMGSPSEMRKFREQVLEVKNLLHSGINWKIIDDGWKTLSDQGWREKDIRRALFMALNEKRQEIKNAELENILRSPMNIDDIWDQISDSWKKNLYKDNGGIDYQKIKGTNQAGDHLATNDEWRKEMDILQSPKSDMKNFVKEDEGWQKLVEQGKNNPKSQMEANDEWANKFSNILQSSDNKKKDNDEKKDKHSKDVWKDRNTGKTDEEPEELQMNFDDFSTIIQAIKDHQKGMDDEEINDEFINMLQLSYKKWKKNQFKKKQPKDDSEDKNIDETENDNQPQQSPINFEDFIEVIEAIREKGKKEAEKQKDDEQKNEMGTLYSSKPTDKRWKQIDDHFKTLIEYERNSFFGRNDGDDTTSSPDDISPQKSMPFFHNKLDKMGKEWQKITEQGLKEKAMKEAVYKAWKNGDKLRNSAIGQNNMKWKKVNDGWKTISNKS